MFKKEEYFGTGLWSTFVISAVLFAGACSTQEAVTPHELQESAFIQSRPNILLVVADDLGYTELSVYGGDIDTPNIDSLAENGIRYTSFYVHSNCSPTRAMLLSGVDNHLAGLGAMHGMASKNQLGQPGYEGFLNQQTLSFAKLLQEAGYKTFLSGKWHLGKTAETLPAAKGFDRYFIQVAGGPPGGHFNLNGAGANARGAYIEDGVDRTGTPVDKDFYSSNFYTDKLLEYLKAEKDDEAPFFAYLAFSAPHTPLQAPDSHIDLYKGRYDEGYDVIRERRIEKMRRLGLVDNDVFSGPRAPTVTPWDKLSEQEKRDQARRMEVYAGVIDNLDDNIGRVLDYLQEADKIDNTLILVMSDNGAAGFNGWQSEKLRQRFKEADNSLDNLGRDGSMTFYGPGWASAGSAPFYLFKRHMAEGGIRSPLIISGPGVNHKGSVTHELVTVRDIAPTLLEIAETSYPKGPHENREILPQTGVSFAAQLAGEATVIHSSSEVFGWELFTRRAVRKGDWKALWLEAPFGTDQWQLYNLRNDPGEANDLAQDEPQKLQEMIAAWNQYALENNVIIGNSPLVFP